MSDSMWVPLGGDQVKMALRTVLHYEAVHERDGELAIGFDLTDSDRRNARDDVVDWIERINAMGNDYRLRVRRQSWWAQVSPSYWETIEG